MKRTALARRTALRARTQLRSRPQRIDRTNPARQIWKEPKAGFCQCGECGRFTLHLERHHIVTLEAIKREGRLDMAWDLRNALLLHPICHSRHTNAVRRLSLAAVPACAFVFAVDLLGDDRAALYFARFYRGSIGERAA